MSFEKTGGPAFPATIGPGGSEVQVAPEQWAFPGMTMRDYFAAKAMQGFASSIGERHFSGENIARSSYSIADAMMKARDA